MGAPPELKSWSKRNLIREVERLRAILKEHAESKGDKPIADGGDLVDVAGDPYARGGVVLDARNAILMDHVDVSLIDTKREGEQLALALLLQGRMNFREDRAQQLYLINEDGAAAIVTELLGLAHRIGPAFERRFRERLEALP
jgi:hypothetical protein